MSLPYLRDGIMRRLQERADAATSRAINIRVRPASETIPAMSCEEYAMIQVDALTEARVLLQAIHIVNDEYNRMTQPEKVQEQAAAPAKKQESVY
jgi:hypothetical protein